MKSFRKVIFKKIQKSNIKYEFFRPWNDEDTEDRMIKIFVCNGDFASDLKEPWTCIGDAIINSHRIGLKLPSIRYNFTQK